MKPVDSKLIININDNKYHNWKSCLIDKLKDLNQSKLEINCEDLNLSCTDILSIVRISEKHNCKIISFFSTSKTTIVSTQSLGYPSQYIVQTDKKTIPKASKENADNSSTYFHKGTLRSGEYLDSPGDLLIFGDVNPGAIVRAAGNVIIWGRLLGIAHAGNKGNANAKIAALQLRPVQLRIANKVARGPQEKPQLGLAEEASIASEKIIISPIETI
tara:strand:- start:765 stop:1412 length:648 start_codon:yes stop_codon:yes gene_type:complete